VAAATAAHLGLVAAWNSWAHGGSVADSVLWGMRILWWGRIGKIAEVVSALTVIAEIVGPERLRATGHSLRGKFEFRRTGRHLVNSARWTVLMWKYFFSETGSEAEHKALAEAETLGAYRLNFVVTLVAAILIGIFEGVQLDWLHGLMLGVMVLVVGFFVLCPVLTTLVIIAFFTFGTLLDVLVFEPVAKVFDRPDVGTVIKLAGLIVLVLGFHFDLLAS